MKNGAYEMIQRVQWDDPKLREVTVLRLKDHGNSDPDLYVTECMGVLRDGTPCVVAVPFRTLPKTFWLSTIIEYAKRAGNVYARALGFDRRNVVTVAWANR